MPENTTNPKTVQTPSSGSPSATCSASSVRLYEINAIISRSVVIAATSKEDALSHVETWEKAWETSSELIGVSDVDLFDVRDMATDDWNDEANEATPAAISLLNAESRHAEKDAPI